jgi:uncharacterized membrane protein
MKALGWWSQGSFALSVLCLILAILAKVGAGEIAGISSRGFYAVAVILGVYSIVFSLWGARSQAGGG